MMSISHLDAHGTFGPDALGTLRLAFDTAWAEIAASFGNDPAVVGVARNELADALLRAADEEGCYDVGRLKAVALHTMAVSYPNRRRTLDW
jgi:hypothetical protein